MTPAMNQPEASCSAAKAAEEKASLTHIAATATTVEKGADTRFAKVSGTAYAPTPAGATSYTVVSGDTLSSIARKHSVAVADLRRWNHLGSDQVKPGQKLVVAAQR